MLLRIGRKGLIGLVLFQACHTAIFLANFQYSRAGSSGYHRVLVVKDAQGYDVVFVPFRLHLSLF